MADANSVHDGKPPQMMRVAVEGCGHGTLDAIYSSILKASAVRGWDGVDLVIIGGDFQAVRDQKDLNVTAMPAKYRRMADFHQYYWGTKTAPFLTVFIGGNHEASNHLYELYYGGWVAPNIYYLGAANVIQVGSLKISGMSGIWKGYDYRKPHYERLPYSDEEMYSIYHVRELDVRKLLAVRSQVDIGMSHDWPKGIEWLGDHAQLFKHKPHLKEDAQSGKLGNTAAQKVMDRLRPPFWFSAHLHTKYVASKRYDGGDETVKEGLSAKTPVAGSSRDITLRSAPHQEQLSAWNNFGAHAREDEMAETTKVLGEERSRRAETERSGVPMSANYKLEETYKKVRLGNGPQHDDASAAEGDKPDASLPSKGYISQLDGSCASLPMKRRRESNSSPDHESRRSTRYTSIQNAQHDGLGSSVPTGNSATNPDAIDIDMSDDETTQLTANKADDSNEGEHSTIHQSDLHADATDVQPLLGAETSLRESATTESTSIVDSIIIEARVSEEQPAAESVVSEPALAANDVSDEMRAQLAALSNKFEERVQVSASLPHPEAITNTTTRFLALSKCEDKQNFLQLLEIEPYDRADTDFARPVKLQYVPEWLAILRVFSSELTLGGNANAQIPQHKGDTFYRDRIIEEEKWVQQNIVDRGLLAVPENFVTYAATSDAVAVPDCEMPREKTNPQTTTFCELIGIENPFDISEEERDARMNAGPARTNESASRGRGGHGRGGGRGRGHSHRGGSFRGGRGHGSHFGGRGRGRGRG